MILLGEMTKYRSCFDVYYYDISVQVFPSEKSIKGYVQILSRATEDFDTLQIDLHPNFEILQLISGETGEHLNYSRQERAVFIENPQQKGSEFTLEIAYEGKPLKAKRPPWRGGFVWKKDKEKNPWIAVACESDGASIWWPLKDHTADEPDSMRMHYTVPSDLIAVGNGQLKGTETVGDSTTYDWFVSYPINTYNATIYVGNFVKITDQYEGINGKLLDLTYYVLPNHVDTAKKHFQQVDTILRVFEKKFGEYPWYQDGFKLVESPFAGMEHQSAIAYGSGYENAPNFPIDWLLVHETAHEWWGNAVTAEDLADVWLQEGFATYAEILYMEEIYGYGTSIDELDYREIFIKNKYPVVGIKGRRWFHFRKNSDVYNKGAWILQTLRETIDNDELFFDIISAFYKENKYHTVTSEDFIELVNRKTRKDYNWFFDQYLHNNSIPVLQVHWEYGEPATFVRTRS
jgi:aminopeptidase N